MEQQQISTRSNYFHVKDLSEFTAWADGFGFEITTENGMVALSHPRAGVHIGQRIGSAWMPLKLSAALAERLADESVAVIFESDIDASYGTANSYAVNSKGHMVQIALDDIFEKATSLGTVSWDVP